MKFLNCKNMLIDFHTHIFPDKIAYSTISSLSARSNNKPNFNGTANGLIEHAKASNFDMCVTLPVLTKPTQFDSVVKYALEINESQKNSNPRLLSFAGMHPQCEDIYGKMKFLKEMGFLGVKIHPDYQNTFIDDEGYINILKAAKDFDLIVVTHSGVDDGFAGEPVKCPPELVKKVINKVNHNKFVLAHFGGNRLWEKVYELLAGENVYFDTAYTFTEIEKELFIKIMNKHGVDKILFASDSPWRNIKIDADIFRSYNLGKEIEDKIFYQNALKLLNIKDTNG